MILMAFDPKKLGQSLLRIMKSRDLSANKIADDLEWSQSTITRITSGETQRPRIDTLTKLADYLGVTVSQLIGESPLNTDPTYAEIESTLNSMSAHKRNTVLSIARTIAMEPGPPYQ